MEKMDLINYEELIAPGDPEYHLRLMMQISLPPEGGNITDSLHPLHAYPIMKKESDGMADSVLRTKSKELSRII